MHIIIRRIKIRIRIIICWTSKKLIKLRQI